VPVFIDLLAAFVDGSLQLVGFLRRNGAGGASDNRLALLLADSLSPSRTTSDNVKDSIGNDPVVNPEGSVICRPDRYR
jgi:hypothetical protein